MKNKASSLKFRLWKYFSVFAASIMIVLWILEIVFLQTYYQSMKLNEVEKIGRELIAASDSSDFQDIINDTTYKTGIFAMLVTKEGEWKNPHHIFMNRIPGMNRAPVNIINEVEMSKTGRIKKAYSEHGDRNKIAVFAEKLVIDGEVCYIIVNAPLAPVDATTQVLQSQLMIVTVISLIFAFILSYFLAKRMSGPITRITESAGELAKGNYEVQFEGGEYSEINTLAEVLNNTTRELGKTDRLRRDLIANVSHDLKTPLTIIKSYAEMIRDLSGNNPEKRTAHTDVIIEEADRLTLLVKDMLDLSVLESGTGTFKMETFNLSETVNSIMTRFCLLEEKEGYSFELLCDDDIYIYADKQRIEQVIFNYITNAVNYTGEDKKIIIDLKETNGKTRFSVTDSGNGIEPDKLDRVWERYYKAGSSGARMSKGSGIGLSIVKEILKSHNAKYGVNSKPGKGSTFWFEFECQNYNREKTPDF